MSRRPKKRCAVCGRDIVPDPLVDPGNPPHRHQACTTAHPTRAHHHMVTLAKSSPSRSTPRPPQNENATVMLVCRASRLYLSAAFCLLALAFSANSSRRQIASERLVILLLGPAFNLEPQRWLPLHFGRTVLVDELDASSNQRRGTLRANAASIASSRSPCRLCGGLSSR